MSAILRDTVDTLEDRYRAALQRFLLAGGEGALQQAYELGRRALGEGLGVLEMAALHAKALEDVISRSSAPEESARLIRTGQSFFVESLSPFEMAYRGFKDANVALRGLNERLEGEAKRIAHLLHDEAGQLLASVYIALEEATIDLPPKDRGCFGQVKALLDQIEVQLRRISHELRPTILDDLGLGPALEFLAEGISARSKIPISVESSIPGRLPILVETTLYRSVQEALTNAARHAHATCMSIHLQQEPLMIRCSVKDNGVGFDPRAVPNGKGQPCLGLVGIQERLESLHGTLTITSHPGQGTTLIFTIPLEVQDDAPDTSR